MKSTTYLVEITNQKAEKYLSVSERGKLESTCLPASQANYLKWCITIILCINMPKDISNESKMQNSCVIWCIKSVSSKLAHLEFGKEIFSQNWKEEWNRNSPFKKKKFTIYNSSYIIFKFKTGHREWRSVSNVKLVFLCI